MINKLFGRFSKDLGIDLGTANTLVYARDRGIVIQEPTVVALNTRTQEILAIGEEALRMLGKTPPYIQAIRPLADGVISDFEVSERLLKHFIEKVHKETFTIFPRPRVVIGIPLEVTEVERKAVEDAALHAGAREVHLIEEPIAAAVGARLPIQESSGHFIVDVGGGTTEVAVISLGGVVVSRSVRIGGTEMDEAIIQYVRDRMNVLIGEQTAEEVKRKIGTASAPDESLSMEVKGRDLITGLPREIILSDSDVRDALSRTVNVILDAIHSTLEITPPELSSDIFRRGILLTGGGSLLRGLDTYIRDREHIPVTVADDPLTTVVRGTGIVLENLDSLRDLILPPTGNP